MRGVEAHERRAPKGAACEVRPDRLARRLGGSVALRDPDAEDLGALLERRPLEAARPLFLEVAEETFRQVVVDDHHAVAGSLRLPDPPGGATDLQSALDALADRFTENDD